MIMMDNRLLQREARIKSPRHLGHYRTHYVKLKNFSKVRSDSSRTLHFFVNEISLQILLKMKNTPIHMRMVLKEIQSEKVFAFGNGGREEFDTFFLSSFSLLFSLNHFFFSLHYHSLSFPHRFILCPYIFTTFFFLSFCLHLFFSSDAVLFPFSLSQPKHTMIHQAIWQSGGDINLTGRSRKCVCVNQTECWSLEPINPAILPVKEQPCITKQSFTHTHTQRLKLSL